LIGMRNVLLDYLTDVRDRQRIGIAIAKGTTARQQRRIELADPVSWEFSGFSQNGEDGILDVLRSALLRRDRDFIEIGAADGVQNNTSWLLAVEQYSGLMVEGSATLSAKARRLLSDCSIGSLFLSRFVTIENAHELLQCWENRQPDVLSLDIDGNDYHVAKALFDRGLRPKIAVVEYNSVFGPERSVTIPYDPAFNFRTAHHTQLYYGAALKAWQRFFAATGYRFVTVDRHGVNAFFVDPACFPAGFLDAPVPLAFAENRYQVLTSGRRGEDQFGLIAGMRLDQV
jgi:hypothetical protein